MKSKELLWALALSAALVACDDGTGASAPTSKKSGSSAPGVLDPAARMNEVKSGVKKNIKVRTDNLERGVERSLKEEGQ